MQAAEIPSDIPARRAAMAICADAAPGDLEELLADLGAIPAARDVRRPETGLVMVRGRMGGDGAAFNMGEATVTRAVVEIEGAPLGFAYHLGRDLAKARAAAVIDALWQDPARRGAVEAALQPVRARLDGVRRLAARRAAATRVDFFTLARGED